MLVWETDYDMGTGYHAYYLGLDVNWTRCEWYLFPYEFGVVKVSHVSRSIRAER